MLLKVCEVYHLLLVAFPALIVVVLVVDEFVVVDVVQKDLSG